MTPSQRNRAVEIMQKHGQYGWKIEYCTSDCIPWKFTSDPAWNWDKFTYRAVGPRKRVELKSGMEIKYCRFITTFTALALYEASNGEWFFLLPDKQFTSGLGSCVTHYRWPNGNDNNPWLPIEGEPEIISMGDVE